MSRTIERTVTINAAADVVWRALTDAEELVRWFPVEARIEPGGSGKIWISWGPGVEGEAPITAWEPERRFGWTEDRGGSRIAVDFHVDAAGGVTTVRLVQSGFGAGSEWDNEYAMTNGGWMYFLEHLRWYLERHRGVPRAVIALRETVPATRAESFLRLIGKSGLGIEHAVDAAGARYEATTAAGERLSGIILSASPDTGQVGFTIRELNDAVAFVEAEPAETGSRPALWLSLYGVADADADAVNDRYSRLYRRALNLDAVVGTTKS